MKEPKEHLNIDLEFLDKKEPLRVASKPDSNTGQNFNTSTSASTSPKYNWKTISIIGGVLLLFIILVIFSEDNSTNNTTTGNQTVLSTNTTSSNSDTVVIDGYRCSTDNYDKAMTLNTNESDAQLTVARNTLENQANELDRLKDDIDSSYVNDYSSQYQINQYNATVDEYNTKLTIYKRAESGLEMRINKYNSQVETYNNFLKNNCTPNR